MVSHTWRNLDFGETLIKRKTKVLYIYIATLLGYTTACNYFNMMKVIEKNMIQLDIASGVIVKPLKTELKFFSNIQLNTSYVSGSFFSKTPLKTRLQLF